MVTYRSSGVIDVATGAIALLSAYTYGFLRASGELIMIIPGFPHGVDLGGAMGFWPATVIALLMSALVGLLLSAVVFRPLRAASFALLPRAQFAASA